MTGTGGRLPHAIGLLVICALALAAALAEAGAAIADGGAPQRWVGTWAASPQAPTGVAQTGLANQTERAIVHVSVGGDRVRVRLSNAFGAGPVTLNEVDVAVRAAGPAVVAGTVRRLRFHGHGSVTIAAGQEVLSDATRMTVRPEQDLAVSVAATGQTGPATQHALAVATSYLSAAGSGNHAADVGAEAFTTSIFSWLFVDGVDVRAAARGALVAFGDSITDGFRSTQDANRRWPDDLAHRLLELPARERLSVLNEGISGNRLLIDSPQFGVRALDRFQRDVLDQTGVTDVIVLLGINDIGQSPHQFDPGVIEGALAQLAARAHARHLRVLGGTMLPFKGTFPGYYTSEGDATRQAVNQWIRTSGTFDAVVDFDRLMGDANDPLILNPAFDSGDHLHPNDLGYQTMADAIDLRSLRR